MSSVKDLLPAALARATHRSTAESGVFAQDPITGKVNYGCRDGRTEVLFWPWHRIVDLVKATGATIVTAKQNPGDGGCSSGLPQIAAGYSCPIPLVFIPFVFRYLEVQLPRSAAANPITNSESIRRRALIAMSTAPQQASSSPKLLLTSIPAPAPRVPAPASLPAPPPTPARVTLTPEPAEGALGIGPSGRTPISNREGSSKNSPKDDSEDSFGTASPRSPCVDSDDARGKGRLEVVVHRARDLQNQHLDTQVCQIQIC